MGEAFNHNILEKKKEMIKSNQLPDKFFPVYWINVSHKGKINKKCLWIQFYPNDIIHMMGLKGKHALG